MPSPTETLAHVLILFPLGLFVGSFLNTLSTRWPEGIPLLAPAVCPRCRARITFVESIPVVGYLLRWGRCRHCEGRLHPREPAVELLTGVLYAFAGARLAALPFGPVAGVSVGVLLLAFMAAMILAALVDLDRGVIPEAITASGTMAALFAAPVFPMLHRAEAAGAFMVAHPTLAYLLPGRPPWLHGIAASLAGAGAGLAAGMAMYFFGSVLFRRRLGEARIESALGMGDVKLLVFQGAFLGWRGVLFALAVAAVSGALAGSFLKVASGGPSGSGGWSGLRNRWRTGVPILPFGPFLALGALAYVLWGWMR